MSEENFSPQESLQLIQSMIEKAKRNMSRDSHYFLLWGWITFAACLGQFILKHVYDYPKHYYVWWVIVVGVVCSIYFSIRDKKIKKVKTYVGESMSYLWSGMAITFFVLGMMLSKIGWETTIYPFYILLYGLGTFVSGCFLQFKPLVIGGILAWVLAIATVYLPYDYQMLMCAAAILFSYIIPGHLLKGINHSKS